MYAQATNQYQQVKVQSQVMSADPYHLVTMLLEGARERISAARVRMQHKAMGEKGKLIGNAIAIVDSLRACLDKEKGGEIAVNLDGLYSYMSQRLFEANVRNDLAALDEVAVLLQQIEDGWKGIEQQAMQMKPNN